MILADTSAWIGFLRGSQDPVSERLAFELGRGRVVVGDLIVVEVLQGFKPGRLLLEAERHFNTLSVATLCGPEMAPKAAANYRALRRLGLTVRGAIDVIIATWCIEYAIPLLHDDRDFDLFQRHLGLQPALA